MPRSGGRGFNRFAVVVQCLPGEPTRLLGDVGVEVAPPADARGYLGGGIPIRHEEPSELPPHAVTPPTVGQAHTLNASLVLHDLEGVIIEAAREPQSPFWGEGVKPESAVLARDRRLPVGLSVVPLVLLAPRIQNLLGVVDDSVSVESDIQEHDTTSYSLLRRRYGDTRPPRLGCRSTPPDPVQSPHRPTPPSAHQRAASRTSRHHLRRRPPPMQRSVARRFQSRALQRTRPVRLSSGMYGPCEDRPVHTARQSLPCSRPSPPLASAVRDARADRRTPKPSPSRRCS